MSDQMSGTDDGITRRNLLRVTGIGAGVGLVGIGGSADQAAATYCPRSPEYWAEHDWPETGRIGDPFVLVDRDDERSVAVWQLFLARDPDEDKGVVMARHLLAAYLNFQFRSTDDPDCVDQPLSAYGGRTIRELKAEARRWLVASNWPDEQLDWVVDGVDGEPLKDALGAFNHGQLPELDCSCGYVDRDDDWSPSTDLSNASAESPALEGNRSDGFEGAQRTATGSGDEEPSTAADSDDESCSGSRSRWGPCPVPRLWR